MNSVTLPSYSNTRRTDSFSTCRRRRRFHCRCTPESKGRTRIGLVLGGGGMKAVSHIGVMRVLRLAGIEPQIVAGSSAGSLVALFYCAGFNSEQMSGILIRELSPGWFSRIIPGSGVARLAWLLRAGGLRRLIARYIKQSRLEELPTPLLVSTTDLVNAESIVLQRGSIVSALLASMSLPGLSHPIRHNGRLLIDGSVLNDLPVDLVRRQGADMTIAIDLNGLAGSHNWKSNGERIRSSQVVRRALLLQKQSLVSRQAQVADVVIRPQLDAYRISDFTRLEEFIRLGELAAQSALPAILAGLRRKRNNRETRRQEAK